MIRNFSDILGAAGFAFAVAVCLLATIGASKAGQYVTARASSAPVCAIPASIACVRKTPLFPTLNTTARKSKFAKSIKGLLMLQCRKLSTFVRHRKRKFH